MGLGLPSSLAFLPEQLPSPFFLPAVAELSLPVSVPLPAPAMPTSRTSKAGGRGGSFWALLSRDITIQTCLPELLYYQPGGGSLDCPTILPVLLLHVQLVRQNLLTARHWQLLPVVPSSSF